MRIILIMSQLLVDDVHRTAVEVELGYEKLNCFFEAELMLNIAVVIT